MVAYMCAGAFLAASAMWVFMDAQQQYRTFDEFPNATKPFTWALAVAAVWVVYFPWYLSARDRLAKQMDASSEFVDVPVGGTE